MNAKDGSVPYLSFGCVVQPPEDESYPASMPSCNDIVASTGARPVPPPPLHHPANQIETSFAEMVTERVEDRVVPLVVLDCANIGWCYGVDRFDAQGVIVALLYFQSRHLECQAFIPAAYLRVKPRRFDNLTGNAMMQTDEVESLQRLAASAALTVVPSGDSDDAYILNYARDNNGFVISNDLFHDHLRNIEVDSVRNSMNVWLSEHRCGYAFTSRRDFVFNPCSSLRSAIHLYQSALALQQQAPPQDVAQWQRGGVNMNMKCEKDIQSSSSRVGRAGVDIDSGVKSSSRTGTLHSAHIPVGYQWHSEAEKETYRQAHPLQLQQHQQSQDQQQQVQQHQYQHQDQHQHNYQHQQQDQHQQVQQHHQEPQHQRHHSLSTESSVMPTHRSSSSGSHFSTAVAGHSGVVREQLPSKVDSGALTNASLISPPAPSTIGSDTAMPNIQTSNCGQENLAIQNLILSTSSLIQEVIKCTIFFDIFCPRLCTLSSF